MQLITIKSKTLTVQIDPMGAELKSVKKGDTEFMWEADPNVWAGSAPVLFPICGRLKDGKYTYEGQEYELPIHGFAKSTEFEVESLEEDRVVFFTKSTESTKKVYPFDFEFRVLFTLNESTLGVSYQIKNCSEGPLYCSVGSHEAYACPEGIEEYIVEFEKEEEMEILAYEDGKLCQHKVPLQEKSNRLPLSDDLFDIDSLVFEGLKSDKVTLIHRNSSKKITVSFPNHPYFIIWHKPGGKYICLEPWCGMGTMKGTGYELTDKVGIMKIEKEKEVFHQITFEI